MKLINVFDTSVGSYNLGNQIIMEAIHDNLASLFPDTFRINLSANEKLTKRSFKYINQAELSFFGGTNALTSNQNKEKYINLDFNDVFLKELNLVLFGVGWWQYQNKPNFYTKIFLNKLLSKSSLHSVRDSYTQNMLKSIDITNVVNTSCPTVWSLNTEHCKSIPVERSENVIFTVTDYMKDASKDINFITILLRSYKNIFFWPQGIGDVDYLFSLKMDMKLINMLNPNLSSLDALLRNTQVDYIGTRLHAGIRALQFKRRTLILSVDNRANEICKDINLNVTERNNCNAINEFISEDSETKISLPLDNIKSWKEQFIKNE